MFRRCNHSQPSAETTRPVPWVHDLYNPSAPRCPRYRRPARRTPARPLRLLLRRPRRRFHLGGPGGRAKWGECMRSAGFDVPDPADEELASGVVRTPPGADEQAFGTSAKACQQKLGLKGTDDAQRQTWERQYDQVASCIREHGFADFPEQEPGTLNPGDYARAQEPAFEKTFSDCLAEFAPGTKQSNPS